MYSDTNKLAESSAATSFVINRTRVTIGVYYMTYQRKNEANQSCITAIRKSLNIGYWRGYVQSKNSSSPKITTLLGSHIVSTDFLQTRQCQPFFQYQVELFSQGKDQRLRKILRVFLEFLFLSSVQCYFFISFNVIKS